MVVADEAGVLEPDNCTSISPSVLRLSSSVGEAGSCISRTSFSTILCDTCSDNFGVGAGGGLVLFFFCFFALPSESGPWTEPGRSTLVSAIEKDNDAATIQE